MRLTAFGDKNLACVCRRSINTRASRAHLQQNKVGVDDGLAWRTPKSPRSRPLRKMRREARAKGVPIVRFRANFGWLRHGTQEKVYFSVQVSTTVI